jgi:hypothetical protein
MRFSKDGELLKMFRMTNEKRKQVKTKPRKTQSGLLAYPFIALLLGMNVPLYGVNVDEVMDRMEENDNPESARMEMTQIVYDPDGDKSTSKLISYSADEGDKRLMEYTVPARIKGMKILILNEGDDIWFSSPRTGRVRKLASHQKNSSINNSDFTYEDMSATDWRKKYDCSLAGTEERNGTACYKLVMEAKRDDQTYSKIVFWVDTSTYVGREAEFYDEYGDVWKKLRMEDIVKRGDSWTPKRIEMRNLQKATRTVMRLDKVEYDIDLNKTLFTERYLKR